LTPYYEQDGITIFHGDCREILPSLRDGSVDLILTDPPYGHENNSGDLADAYYGNGERGWAIKNDSADDVRGLVEEYLFQREFPRLLRDDGCCCCCCGGGGPDPMFARWSFALDKVMKFNHAIVWYKGDWAMGWQYRRTYEFVLVAYNGKKTRFFGRSVPNVIMMPKARGKHDHPNYKPVALMGGFIERHTQTGELVVDPFAGGGSSLVAAKRLNRRAIGIEIEEKYCEIAVKRLAQMEMF
jgi:site-specific DNA-methyltransferase (adenine-specific)